MNHNEIIGSKLKKLRKLMGFGQQKLSDKLTDYIKSKNLNKRYDETEKEKIGFSIYSIGRFENGKIPESKKDFIAQVYSDYCKDSKSINKSQITKEIILSKVKTNQWIETIWDGFPLEKDFTDFESANILLDIPEDENLKLPEPEFFRVSGPEYTDFKHDCVYINDKQLEEISNRLKKERIVLMQSNMPASGKSVLGRALAYSRYGDGLQTHFFQVSDEYDKSTLSTIMKQIVEFGSINPDNLLIIEDAHLNPTFVNDLLKKRHLFLTEILITSRKIHGILRSEKNLFNSLETLTIKPSKNLIDEIVERYVKEKLPNFKERLYELKKSINDFYNLKFWKGSVNLWLLSYALRAIESKKDISNIKISKQDIINEVEQDLQKIEKGQTLRIQLLIALSVLYRFEIKTSIQWLHERFFPKDYDEIRDTLEKLYKEGEVTRSSKKLYGIPHSSLAELYFEFTKEPNGNWQEKKIYGNEKKFLWAYYLSDESNVNKSLARALVSELNINELSHKINELNSLSKVTMFIILAFDPWQKNNKKLWEKIDTDILIKKIDESDNLISIAYCIKAIFNISTKTGKKLWKKIDKDILIEKIDESDNLITIAHCIKAIFRASKETGGKLWEGIDKDILIRKIDKSDSLNSINQFIKTISSASKKYCKDFLKKIDKDIFIKKINESDSLELISVFIVTIFTASMPTGKDLPEKANMDILIKKINESDSLIPIAHCIRAIFSISKETGKELLEKTDKDMLIKKIDESDSLFWISIFIKAISSISKETGRELLEKTDKDILIKKINESDRLNPIGRFIKTIFNISIDTGEELWKKIDKNRLIKKINESDNLDLICIFISTIFSASIETGKDLLGKIDMDILIKKINDFDSLKPTNNFIENFFRNSQEASKELIKKIDKKILIKKIVRSDSLFWISDFIKTIFSISIVIGKDFLGKADKDIFIKKINESDNLKEIECFIKTIFIISRETGEELWKKIDKDILMEKIKSDDIDLAVKFIETIFNVSEQAGKELRKQIGKDIFIKRIMTYIQGSFYFLKKYTIR